MPRVYKYIRRLQTPQTGKATVVVALSAVWHVREVLQIFNNVKPSEFQVGIFEVTLVPPWQYDCIAAFSYQIDYCLVITLLKIVETGHTTQPIIENAQKLRRP